MPMNGYVDNRGFIPKSRANLRSKVDLSKTYSQKKKEKTKRNLGKLRRNDTDFRKEYKLKGGGKIPRKNKPIEASDKGSFEFHRLPANLDGSLTEEHSKGFGTRAFRSGGWSVKSSVPSVVTQEAHANRLHEAEQHRIANKHDIRKDLLAKGYYQHEHVGHITDLDTQRLEKQARITRRNKDSAFADDIFTFFNRLLDASYKQSNSSKTYKKQSESSKAYKKHK